VPIIFPSLVARILDLRKEEMRTKIFRGRMRREETVGDRDVYVRIILKWILEKQVVNMRTALNWHE
jgi:hypothetical protein